MDGDVRSLKWSELITRGGLTQGWSGPVDPTIETIVEDSRQVRPGSCFVAVRGTQADGHQFIEQAIRDGAAAIVSEHSCTVPQNFPVLTLPTTRGAAGRLASVLAGLDELQRAGRFKLVGITGTNGKSTFCYLLRSILQAAGHPTATLGTIEYDLIARRVEAAMTTPPPTTLMTYLGEAARAGATHAVMEVSSHALDQGRCDGLRFDVGVFSNLTGDHLDYHKTTEAYLRAKKKLFDQLSADAVAVIKQEDPAGGGMVAPAVAERRATELTRPDDHRRIKKASLLQVLNQAGPGLINLAGQALVTLVVVAVRVPVGMEDLDESHAPLDESPRHEAALSESIRGPLADAVEFTGRI